MPRKRTFVKCLIFAWIAGHLIGCATPAPAKRVGPVEPHAMGDFANLDQILSSTSEKGTTVELEENPDGTVLKNCIGKENLKAPESLRGQCWVKTCVKKGFREKCSDNGNQAVLGFMAAQKKKAAQNRPKSKRHH